MREMKNAQKRRYWDEWKLLFKSGYFHCLLKSYKEINLYSNKIWIWIKSLSSTMKKKRKKSKFNMLKLTSFVLDCNHQASLKIPPNSLQKGSSDTGNCCSYSVFHLIQWFGSGRGKHLASYIAPENFRFKITSTLSTAGAITICYVTSKNNIHRNLFLFFFIVFHFCQH